MELSKKQTIITSKDGKKITLPSEHEIQRQKFISKASDLTIIRKGKKITEKENRDGAKD